MLTQIIFHYVTSKLIFVQASRVYIIHHIIYIQNVSTTYIAVYKKVAIRNCTVLLYGKLIQETSNLRAVKESIPLINMVGFAACTSKDAVLYM